MPDLTKEIREYAMESVDNLIVVVQTARSFDELRRRLILSFVQKLEEELKHEFPVDQGWEIRERSLITNPFGKGWRILAIRKEAWPPQLSVAIAVYSSFKDVDYGVYWEEKLQRANPTIRDGIYALMGEKFHSNSSEKSWPWFVNSKRFGNWFQEDALISMRQVVRGESAEILKFFLDELVAIAKALDQYLNPVAGSGH